MISIFSGFILYKPLHIIVDLYQKFRYKNLKRFLFGKETLVQALKNIISLDTQPDGSW